MELIDKSALLAEIERMMAEEMALFEESLKDDSHEISAAPVVYTRLQMLLSAINTLEVKEVDLDFQRFAKEMDAIFALPSSETKNTEEEPLNWEYAIAKHFFELGLKAAQKVEKV